MKFLFCRLTLLCSIFWCNSSLSQTSNSQPDNFVDSSLIVNSDQAYWRNDSLNISKPDPMTSLKNIIIESLRAPKLIRKVIPQFPNYPSNATAAGSVYLRVFIDSSGYPRKAFIVSSMIEYIDMPVMHAVMFCLFSPLVIDGKSKSQWIMVGVRLHMVKGKLTADYVER